MEAPHIVGTDSMGSESVCHPEHEKSPQSREDRKGVELFAKDSHFVALSRHMRNTVSPFVIISPHFHNINPSVQMLKLNS